MRKGNVHSGQKILINGAGRSIGTFAVQLAKYFGTDVTAVDSAEELGMLRSIGADHVIDYTQEDSTESGETYDVILDVVGKISFSPNASSLKQDGAYITANPRLPQMVQGLWTSMRSSKTAVMETASGTIEDLIFLGRLIEEGELRSVIDRCYPLEQIAEAHGYVEAGRRQGNVVISVSHDGKTWIDRCSDNTLEQPSGV